jgi:chemotaxis protein methyltransferase WspC
MANMPDSTYEIKGLLAAKIGLDPASVGPQLIGRAAKRRMSELHVHDLDAYARIVCRSEPELQELIDQVVVSESWFFRDDQPFQWLKEYVKRRWLKELSRAPLRVLSLGCAAGEEPYSIAMTLLDSGLTACRFKIDAIDVSVRRLNAARAGVFSANSFRGSDLSYQARYFHKCREGYELDHTVRSTVNFLHGNVLTADLLKESSPYDVIFCRNLLIYLDAQARTCVRSIVNRLLAIDGVLFIGHADRLELGGTRTQFIPLGEAALFAYQRSTSDKPPPLSLQLEAPRVLLGLIGPPPAARSAATIPPVTSPSGMAPVPALGAATVPKHAELLPPLLDQAAELANRGQFKQAMAVCEQHLRQKGATAPAYFLMGMIYQAAKNAQRAEECLQKAVYLDPKHDEALLALALLAERRGDHGAAASFRRRAERTLIMARNKVD